MAVNDHVAARVDVEGVGLEQLLVIVREHVVANLLEDDVSLVDFAGPLILVDVEDVEVPLWELIGRQRDHSARLFVGEGKSVCS